MVDYHLPDLYGDLECDATADQAEIKKQYRKLADKKHSELAALRHHPDRNPGKESEFATKFQAIQLASHVLGDPALRASYDAKRNQQNSRANAHFSFPSFKTENPSKKPDAAHAFKKSAESENQVDKNGRISTSCATAEDEKTYFPSQDLENLSSWKGKKRDSKRYDSELNVAEHVHPRATSARLNRKHRNSAPKEEAHSLAEADAAGFQEREALPRAMQEEMEKNRLRKLGAQTPSLSKTPPAITMPFALKSEEKRSDVSQSLQHKTRDNTLTSSNSSSSRNNVEAKRQISPIENCVRPSQVVQSVQKDAPNIINELAKKAASRIFELQNPMDHIREEIESNISAFPKNLHNAAFAVHWNLNKYIEQELKQNQNLAHILTVSGSAKSAYSTTCADYVNMLWPDTGPWMLETLQIVIDRGSYQAEMATDATGVIAVDACNELDGSMTIKISSSRSILVNIAQQLAWLAAISRISFIEELTYSHVQFRHLRANEFEITVLGDRKLCKGDEMCWHPLFANTVIAYGFPVPPRNGEMGIEIPFDIMLRLARITYAVTYDDGLVLSGFSTLLFPSAYHQPKSQTAPQSHTVQWHLVTGTDDHTRISAGAELAQYDHLWLKIKDEELLRSARTFLGHCRIACVRLGTENSGFSDVSESSLADDKPNPAISVRSGSIGTSGMGILGATMNVEAVLPRGLARMTKIDYYNDILWTAKSMPIILYDANQQQAWLVPTLSVILHMVHAWVATHAPDIQLPYAKPDWNGGQAAWDIIAKFSRLELQRSLENDTPYFLKDLVKRLWEHLVSCFDSLTLDTRRSRGMIKTGHPKLRGWEYMDIVNPPVRSKMKEQVLDRSGCGWEILTEDVLLLVCKGLGEVIQPAQPGSLCAELYPMQRGSKYLTASVACLRHLSQKRGMGVTCTKLADHVFWPPPTPNLFDDCSHGTERPCHKALQQLVEKECRESTTAVPAEAAVLFGHRTTKLKKKVPKSLVKKSSKMMANGSLVECTNQCVVNASLHSAECYSQPLSQGESTVSSTQPAQSEGIPGFSSLALANERYTGLSTQETTDQNTPRKSVQSIPKTTDELIQKPRSHAWRRELFG